MISVKILVLSFVVYQVTISHHAWMSLKDCSASGTFVRTGVYLVDWRGMAARQYRPTDIIYFLL